MKTTRKIFLPGILFLFLLSGLMSCSQNNEVKTNTSGARGEFDQRYQMVVERMQEENHIPVFTRKFILADVNLDPENPRRFYNFSGDLSGRYIEAFSVHCHHEECKELSGLVKEVLSYQKPDGRFGDSKLIFKEEFINEGHTPLLWGNGRMLVGLTEHYQRHPDQEVLDAAIRLGDFFKSTYQEVTPAVVKRLEGMGAAGTICFTQWTEPLVMLSEISGNPEYAEIAAAIYPTLPPRGIQHSHGYLSTLRGVLNLYEYTGAVQHLDYVVSAYTDMVNSDDFTIYGSVMEYFGGKGGRDEGCSTVDFIRLSLHLYKLTRDVSFMDKAEFAIYNALYYNQFFTGDFGSHFIDHNEAYSKVFNACWWCCTMAGMRALQVIRDEYFVENEEDIYKLNLYLDTHFTIDDLSLSLRKAGLSGERHVFLIDLKYSGNAEKTLALRIPPWAKDFRVEVNGTEPQGSKKDHYFIFSEPISASAQIKVFISYDMGLILPDRSMLSLAEVDRPVKGALYYGPNIMAIDNNMDYTFLAEPSNNQIYIQSIKNGAGDPSIAGNLKHSSNKEAYLVVNYKHAGFPSYLSSLMRPISEMTFEKHPYMKVTHLFLPESFEDKPLSDNDPENLWVEESIFPEFRNKN